MGSTKSDSDISLKDVLDSIKDMKNDIHNDIESLQKHTDIKFSEVLKDVKKIKSDTVDLQNRMDACESSHASLIYEVESIKQRSLQYNICVTGIPFDENEKIGDIFNKLCTAIGFKCAATDVIKMYRTRSIGRKTIVVQFANESVKSNLFKAKKTKQSVLLEELNLGYRNATNEVSINHHMTPYFASLLYNARQAVKRGELESCWFAMRGVVIKSDQASNPVLVTSERGLSQCLPTADYNSKRKASQEYENPPKKASANQTNNKKPTKAKK